MDVQGIFAVICVADHQRSIDWYSKLFGREPDDSPIEGLVQWREKSAGLQIFLDAGRAGSSRVTIVVPEMAKERARAEQAGLKLGPDQSGDFGIVAQISDPDGNLLTLAEPPKGFAGS